MHPASRLFLFLSAVAIAGLTACSGPRAESDDSGGETVGNLIEVEGRVSVRGNEPFTAVLLETDDGNWYVLTLTEEQRRALVNPSVQRARGTVYLANWNERPFAHLRVSEIERVLR